MQLNKTDRKDLSYVYGLFDPYTDKLVYIGKTDSSLFARYCDHEEADTPIGNWIRSLDRKPTGRILSIVDSVNLTKEERIHIKNNASEGLFNIVHNNPFPDYFLDDFKEFFNNLKVISKSGFAREVGVTHQFLNFIVADKRTLTFDVYKRMLPVMKKYGYVEGNIELKKRIKKESDRSGLSKDEIVRRALEEYLKKEKE